MSQSSDQVEIVFDSNLDDSTPLTAEEIARLEDEWPIQCVYYDSQTINWIARECRIPVYKIKRWDAERRANQPKDPLESNPEAPMHDERPGTSSHGQSQSQLDQSLLTNEERSILEKRWPIYTLYDQEWIDWFSMESGIPVQKIVDWDNERRARRNNNVDEGVGSSTENEGTTDEDRHPRLLRTPKHARQDESESDEDRACKKMKRESQE